MTELHDPTRHELHSADISECGHCLRQWCDVCHPTPAGRCWFEADHEYAESTATEDFEEAQRATHLALRHLSALADKLPELTECCENPELQVVTLGVEQWCRAERLDDGHLHAITNGWDDLGDMDGPSYVNCLGCGEVFRVPDFDGITWD